MTTEFHLTLKVLSLRLAWPAQGSKTAKETKKNIYLLIIRDTYNEY